MPHDPDHDDAARTRTARTPPETMRTPPKDDQKADRKAEEVLREQSMTETEARPYLDTEGGE